MILTISKPKVLVLRMDFAQWSTKFWSTRFEFSSFEESQTFSESESEHFQRLAECIKKTGIQVVVNQGPFHRILQE